MRRGLSPGRLLTAWMAFVAVGTQYPQDPPTIPITHNLVPLHNLAVIARYQSAVVMAFNLASNVALFVPLGLLLPEVWPSARRWPVALATGAAASATIEITQWVLPWHRLADIDDLLLNVLGTGLGWLAWRRWRGSVSPSRAA